MSEAFERERQNNARLDELSAKVSALRGVTIDIYDNARAQDVIDNTVGHTLFFFAFIDLQMLT
jgi:blocked early in transport 1